MLDRIKALKNKSVITTLVLIVAVIVSYKIIMEIEKVADGLKALFGTLIRLLMPFIIGGILAYLLNPMVNFFEQRVFGRIKRLTKGKTLISLIAVYLFVGAALLVILNELIPLLISSIADIINQIPAYFGKLMEFRNGDWNHSFVGRIIFNIIATGEREMMEFVNNYKLTSLNPAITEIVDGVANITGVIIDTVFGVIISVYFILEKKNLINGIKRINHAFLKPEKAEKLEQYSAEAHSIFSSYIIGKIVDSLIIGVITLIALKAMGVENSTLYSVIIAVTNLIPYFGPFIGGIPVVALILFEDPLQALWVAIFIFALQQVDGMIICPKILGDSIDLSPFWIIFSTIVGGGLFGVTGMLLGAPVLAVIFLALNRFLDRKLDEKKETATETAEE